MGAEQAALTPDSFAAEVARLAGPGFGPEVVLAVAVSGGPDSLALMWLAARAFGARAHVLSVDHGLRADAAGECAMVAGRAADMGLPHATLTLAMKAGANVQAEAREARYAAMGDWCRTHGIGLLLTAHHRDDQAETLLMRMARGSGLSGLAGVRSVSEIGGLRVLRPLLRWSRAELAELVRRAGWQAVADPSNNDPRYDRTAARGLLRETSWLDAARLAASAAHLADAEAALAWAAERAWETRVSADCDGLLIDPEALPADLRRRVLALGLSELGGSADGPALARLMARLDGGGGGTLGGVKATGLPDGRWRLSKAPPRR